MSPNILFTFISLVVGSFGIAFLVLYGLAQLAAHRERLDAITLASQDNDIVFLFDDEKLVNATPAAQSVLAAAADVGSDWSRLLSVMISKFPTLQHEISELADRGSMALESRDGNAVLKCEWRNGLARITLFDRETEQAHVDMDRHSLMAMEQELETLRATTQNVPFLVWREVENGTITWANTAYLTLADSLSETGENTSWPPAALFDTKLLAQAGPNEARRLSFKDRDGTPHWFDIYRFAIGNDALFAGSSADRTVKAEETLREFTQTLTKTFSHLTIGLAVFDRNRRLALFNPALTDLTALPAEFLITRPALTTFLDRLRDNQMMPEPKDYKSWRQEMTALENAAEDGTYEEVWTLPGGMTYRISGRPHPDGAIAFLFEDISAEMSLTRRFRAEIETGQAVLDTLSEAIAVFSSEGMLVMANSAYTNLWGLDQLEGIVETSITDATRIWHAKCAPSPLWGDIREFVTQTEERSDWIGQTRLWDGRRLNCRFVPLPSGQTLVGFTPEGRINTLRPTLRPQASTTHFAEM
ncbi:PAS-domain containing protein [Celeribacter persicus]|uniref:PAS domain-containing protein n=1 Tax=Celeribacter persicus TaxID=1651082 RepID=A0A2T5HDL7_9RHOB|nr:PAS-domain containing protein [Celeribacter persicus]PTQ69673.1 PAS domain-containing protein [Celeribacter persicus]